MHGGPQGLNQNFLGAEPELLWSATETELRSVGSFDFPLDFARGVGKTEQAREGARPHTSGIRRV